MSSEDELRELWLSPPSREDGGKRDSGLAVIQG
jgi:hypothetical protein